jgi:hypothetical protein
LQVQGLNPDASAANLDLLTSKLNDKDRAALKKLMPRKGFVAEWDALDEDAKALSKLLLAKEANVPSFAWKLITTYKPEAVLWLALTGTGAPLQARLKNFFTVWPEARQKIPYTLMQEMRIVPDLPGYQDLQRTLFLEFMDGKLQTEEEMRKFLEPYSPPAPPPPVSVRRAKPKKAEPKKKASRASKAEVMAPPDTEVTVAIAGPSPSDPPAPKKATAKKAEAGTTEPPKAESKKSEVKKPETKKPEPKKPAAPANRPAAPAKKAAKKLKPAKAKKVAAPKNPIAKKPVAKKTQEKKAPAKKPAPKPAKKKR